MKGCMNCGNISCGNNKKRESAGCGRWKDPEETEKEYKQYEAVIFVVQKNLKELEEDYNLKDELFKKIVELEKENAELKEKLNIRSCQNCKNNNKSCPSDGSCKNYSKWEGYENLQLTKAKDLLKWFVWYFREGSPNFAPYKHKVEEVEQFLNREIEK